MVNGNMYINLLTKLKNASMVSKSRVVFPYNKLAMSIADILVKAGYLKEAEKKGRNKKYIEMKLDKRIEGVKILSKPSRHLYAPYKNLKPVRSNYGLGIISTSHGLMTFGDARKQKLGGELLFEIW